MCSTCCLDSSLWIYGLESCEDTRNWGEEGVKHRYYGLSIPNKGTEWCSSCLNKRLYFDGLQLIVIQPCWRNGSAQDF
jgi:hypothetical protein